jgi:hypothetical protein
MGGDLDFAEGGNTVESDVENVPNPVGGVTVEKLGRTNR